jgi:hypothetical protein
MDSEQQEILAQGVGQAIGELVDGFVKIINALRKQPGFDDAAFRSELQTLLASGELRTLQEHMVKQVLGSDAPVP